MDSAVERSFLFTGKPNRQAAVNPFESAARSIMYTYIYMPGRYVIRRRLWMICIARLGFVLALVMWYNTFAAVQGSSAYPGIGKDSSVEEPYS